MKILDLLHIVIKLYIIKDNNDTKLEETIKCYLATNLPIANYNDELIKKIYYTVFKNANDKCHLHF